MATTLTPLERAPSYDEDFAAWARDQAARLRALKGTAAGATLDLDNLIEEVEDLGASERSSVESYTRLVIEHLLLLEHSPARDHHHRHWTNEIDNFRLLLNRKLSPSLRRNLAVELDATFADARARTVRRMVRYGEDKAAEALPLSCPYSLDQVIDDWWPENIEAEDAD